MIPMTPALAAQIDQLDRLAETRDDAMQVSREQGEVMAAIALAHQAKLIVEVGTSYGFSGLWWSAVTGVTGGQLHTIDVLEKKYASAKATFAAAGVADRVTNHLGNAADILAGIDGPIDLAFIDADKPATQGYFDVLWSKVRVGGAVLTDNVTSHREAMGSYLDDLRAREDAHTAVIPIRSGLAYAVKLG